MRVSIIGTKGIPAKYGGFESLVEYLTKFLGEKYDITVFCSSESKFLSKRIKKYNNANLKYLPINANGIQSIIYDIVSIIQSLFFADTLLILGVSGCLILPFVKLLSSKKIIVNIDGLEWKRQKWGKFAKWFLKYSEKKAVKCADIIIADNKVIQDYVKEEYNVDSSLIPYGSDHSLKIPLSDNLINEYSFLKGDYAFKVCRIEPENNIHVILKAFSRQTHLPLVVIGNWNNSSYSRSLYNEFSDIENMILLDPIYEQNMLNQFRSNAFVYVHGHSAGGTNPSLVEAMYLELPVVSFDVMYNKETTHFKAKYFKDEDELIRILENLFKDDLSTMGRDLGVIAREFYTWEKVSAKYAEHF